MGHEGEVLSLMQAHMPRFDLDMQYQDETTSLLISGVERERSVQFGRYQCADWQP